MVNVKYILALATGLVAMNMFAQMYKTSPVEIWPKNVPGEPKAKAAHRLNDNPEQLAEVTNPTLECFRPAPEKNNGQAIVVCPGGAYAILSYVMEGQEIAEWLAGQGYTAYVLAYRIPGKRDGALQDLYRSIRLVRSYGFAQVGCIGFSAGASLCCRASTRWKEQAYDFQDKADALNQRPDFAMLIYPAYLADGENRTLSPELPVAGDTSPMFVWGTQDDQYSAPCTATILDAMQRAGAPIEAHFQMKGGHGYGMRGDGAGKIWPRLAEEWLKEKP